MGILEVLFIVFVVLKLTGLIAWSWWLVSAPVWGAAIAALVVMVLFGSRRRF